MATSPETAILASVLQPLSTVRTTLAMSSTQDDSTTQSPSTYDDVRLMVAQNLYMNSQQRVAQFDLTRDVLLNGTGTFRIVKNKMVLSEVIVDTPPDLPAKSDKGSNDADPSSFIDRDWYGGLDEDGSEEDKHQGGSSSPTDSGTKAPNAEFIAWIQSYRPPASRKTSTRSYRWYIHRDTDQLGDCKWSPDLFKEIKDYLFTANRFKAVGQSRHVDIGIFVYFYPSGILRHWDLDTANQMLKEQMGETVQWEAYKLDLETLLNTFELTPGAWKVIPTAMSPSTSELFQALRVAGLELSACKFIMDKTGIRLAPPE